MHKSLTMQRIKTNSDISRVIEKNGYGLMRRWISTICQILTNCAIASTISSWRIVAYANSVTSATAMSKISAETCVGNKNGDLPFFFPLNSFLLRRLKPFTFIHIFFFLFCVVFLIKSTTFSGESPWSCSCLVLFKNAVCDVRSFQFTVTCLPIRVSWRSSLR